MPIDLKTRYVASDAQVSTRVGDEVVLLGLDDGTYYGLDPVGAVAWAALARPATVPELARRLVAEFEVDTERAERDLVALMEQLLARGLVREAGADD